MMTMKTTKKASRRQHKKKFRHAVPCTSSESVLLIMCLTHFNSGGSCIGHLVSHTVTHTHTVVKTRRQKDTRHLFEEEKTLRYGRIGHDVLAVCNPIYCVSEESGDRLSCVLQVFKV